jgi:hypothetical protein
VLKVPTIGPAEAKNDEAEKPQVEKIEKIPEILSPPAEAKLPKVQKSPAATRKRRRMASVLDAVLETTKALSPGPTKKNAKAAKIQEETEAGPSAPVETKVVAPGDKADQQTSDTSMAKKQNPLPSKPQLKLLITFIDMLRGRNYPKKKSLKPDTMRKN